MKYRSRTDISREILQAASGGTSKTKIMYAAYLSFAQLKEYLAALSESGLLEYDAERTEYRTTAKGMQFLQVYDNMTMLTGELREK
jgi:predicted transcriptional regulator